MLLNSAFVLGTQQLKQSKLSI